jgi:hypothetical protein
MINQRLWSIGRAAGYFLVLGFVASLAGVVMFDIRGGPSGGAPPSHTFFLWERSFFMAAVILSAIGLVLLEGRLQNTDGRVLARTGATTYLIAGTLLVTAEAFRMSLGDEFEKRAYALFVIYVVLAFLAQAAVGGALLQSGILGAPIGWVTIVWNLGLLVVLSVITPEDIYYPIAHQIMPLVIGGALLWRAP